MLPSSKAHIIWSLTLFLLLIFAAPFLSSSMTLSSAYHANKSDEISLLAFRAQINDRSQVLSSWNGTNHVCNWRGVACGSRKHPNRVTSLDLNSLSLSGLLSPSIANLTFLNNLTLDNNAFFGTIPPEIGKLRKLQLLNLSFNAFHGSIPINLTSCSSLTVLDLNSNTLSGKIPIELGSVSKLEFLALSNNSLIGALPMSVGNLSSLRHFFLRTNHIEGSIPHEIGRLHMLLRFQISDNNLAGMLPSTLFNLSSLTYFGIANNQLQGSLPSTMGLTLPNLETILFGGNSFKGLIPNSLSNSSSLSFIDMSINNFNGNLPPNLGRLSSLSQLNLELNQLEARDTQSWEFLTSLANCTKLELLSLYSNNLSGVLPNSIGNLSTNLQELRLNGNQISGTIPSSIGNLVNLSILALGPNLITGNIPESIRNLNRMQLLTLYESRLTGKIPSSLGNLKQLIYLYLTGNNFEGPLPSSLGNLKQLEELGLGNNNLSGTIPREIFSISTLRAFGISYNSFVGSIPFEISNLQSLVTLKISSNKLTGEIPNSLGDCMHLEALKLDKNLFQGKIPSSFAKLKGMQILDLSQNNLTGPVPVFLESLSLTYLNLSFNQFEGEVPTKGIFQNTTAASLQGNDKLCGGIPTFKFSSCPSKTNSKRGISRQLKIVISIASSILLCTLLVISIVYSYRRTKLRINSNLPSSNDRYHRASYIDLVKATDGFSENNLIGSGYHGSVYKGTFDNGKTTIAVKVFNLEYKGASKSFIDECEALRNIRHRNLIKILTSCSTIDSKGNEFKALVFEFMPNGNLDTCIHAGNSSERPSFIQRLDIAIDVVDALDYLHNDCQVPVIHCDLKPSNILLDDNMVAHVTDFGIARVVHEISQPLQDSSSIGIRGTIGYVAPEYGAGSKVSIFGDVYSYGILLLEMFTGRRPVNDMFRDGHNIHEFVMMNYHNRIMEIIDPSLFSEYEERGALRTRFEECVSSILKIGLLCSKESPQERVDMRQAATQLHAIRDVFARASVYGK